MSGTKTEHDAIAKAHEDEKAKAIAAQEAANEEARKSIGVLQPTMVGYDETQPHQEEIVAGSVQQEQLLNAYPNATTYGPEVNVVLAPDVGGPTVVDTPYASQDNGTLSCTMGNWTGEPVGYAYQWKRGTMDVGTNSSTYTLVPGDAGNSMTCTVSATNAGGTTIAPPSNAISVPATRGSKN